LIATEEIERGSPVGSHLTAMLKRRLLENESRRLKKYLDGRRWELYRDRHFSGRAATLERKLRLLAEDRGGSIRVENVNNEKLVVQYIGQ
jgi:hypothetical protein